VQCPHAVTRHGLPRRAVGHRRACASPVIVRRGRSRGLERVLIVASRSHSLMPSDSP
jgi:hypothetical protein